jgi:hypothetical protein
MPAAGYCQDLWRKCLIPATRKPYDGLLREISAHRNIAPEGDKPGLTDAAYPTTRFRAQKLLKLRFVQRIAADSFWGTGIEIDTRLSR